MLLTVNSNYEPLALARWGRSLTGVQDRESKGTGSGEPVRDHGCATERGKGGERGGEKSGSNAVPRRHPRRVRTNALRN